MPAKISRLYGTTGCSTRRTPRDREDTPKSRSPALKDAICKQLIQPHHPTHSFALSFSEQCKSERRRKQNTTPLPTILPRDQQARNPETRYSSLRIRTKESVGPTNINSRNSRQCWLRAKERERMIQELGRQKTC